MEQFGFFETELEERRKEIAAHDAETQLARNERFMQRKAALLADTKSWAGGVFSERISSLLQSMQDAGREAEGMHDAILAGINSAGNMGRLTEQHIVFVEQKARIEVARIGNFGQVKPTTWRERTVADIVAADFGSGQLPVAIQQAAVERLNDLGPQLAALGFQDDVEVDATASKEAQGLKAQLSDVRQALMTLAPARYRHAKGHKMASAEKLDRAETLASTILCIDTRAHPGVDTSIPLTSSGVRDKPVRNTARPAASERAATETTLPVVAGRHIGPIVAANDHSVAQKTGRSTTEVTWHSLLNLVGHAPHVGDMVEISYKNGVGHVAGQNLALERAGQSR